MARRQMVLRLLQVRFGTVPSGLDDRLAGLDSVALDRLLDRVVQVDSLNTFMAAL